MKKIYFFLFAVGTLSSSVFAQVAINKTTADNSAALEINGSNDPDFRGLLIPRMSTLNRKKIPNPADGLLVYDTDKKLFYFFETTWRVVNPFSVSTPDGPDVDAATKVSVALDDNIKDVTVQTPLTVSSKLSVNNNVIVKDTVKASVLQGIGVVPVGGIIMWSGDPATLPATGEWELCDGSLNYTTGVLTAIPDLRERFIVGAGGDNTGVVGGTYAVGANGGAISSAHTHSIDPPNQTITGGAHLHTGTTSQPSGTYDPADSYTTTDVASANHTHTFTTDAGGTHTHTLDIAAFTSAGASNAENRPPYYALAFIIRVK